MSIRKVYSVRDKDVKDHERIETLIRSKGKTLSEIIVRLLRRWEREVTR